MNHLKNETSPYLLQHADNPVDWYPWCGEAFERAKSEDKPVFLSIGYSTCHWCHVMAHESFENSETAELLNKNFISVKVDREERPDIDSVYMTVCQAFTGSGGWPMSVFMTWDKKPFFAGTYFPTTPRFGMPRFRDVLNAVVMQWDTEREKLIQSAENITDMLKNTESVKTNKVNGDIVETAAEMLRKSYDSIYGGFGSAPKFPIPHELMFLMYYAKINSDETAQKMAEKTLIQMRKGGIFDHIGGGFSRYSTDRYFLAPHFEKMLYDNALLIIAYSAMYSLTGTKKYLETAMKTAEYVLREMTSPEGGFYSAQDADSEGVEGKCYTFTLDEIMSVLGDMINDRVYYYRGIATSFSNKKASGLSLIENTTAENNASITDLLPVSSERADKYWNKYIKSIRYEELSSSEELELFDADMKSSTLYTCFRKYDSLPKGVSLARKSLYKNGYCYYIIKKSGSNVYYHLVEDYYKETNEHFRFRYALRHLHNNPVKARFILCGDMVKLHLDTKLPNSEMAFLSLISWPERNITDELFFVFSVVYWDIIKSVLENLHIELMEIKNETIQHR